MSAYLLLSLFILANLGLLVFDVIIVLLSYSISWYEYSNTNPDAIDNRFSRQNLGLVFSLLGSETLFNYITLAVVPFGIFNRKNQANTRGETPVLLLHGLFVNQSCWFWFKWQLKKQGFKNIVTINLSSWHSEEALTELLANKIDELRHQLGVNKVHLVGHSMGGMIARNYVQLRGGHDKVENLICLGSPHQGSRLATFAIDPLGKRLFPNSDFLQRLNHAPAPKDIKVTNIYTNKDNMVLPNASNHLPWGKAIEFDRMGHTALLYRKPVIAATIAALKQAD